MCESVCVGVINQVKTFGSEPEVFWFLLLLLTDSQNLRHRPPRLPGTPEPRHPSLTLSVPGADRGVPSSSGVITLAVMSEHLL